MLQRWELRAGTTGAALGLEAAEGEPSSVSGRHGCVSVREWVCQKVCVGVCMCVGGRMNVCISVCVHM